MNLLRSKLIRLAHANPELRAVLLPLVSRTARDKNNPAYMAVQHLHMASSLLGKAAKSGAPEYRGTYTDAVRALDKLAFSLDKASEAEDDANEPVDKTASLSLVKKDIELILYGGTTKTVSALVSGPWAIYKNIKGAGYAVTFIPTGGAVSTKNPTLMDAKAFLEALLERAPDLARANDVGDVMRHKDIIVDLLKNPPAVSGTARKGPVEKVSEKRERLIADIKAAGLIAMGTRSGKAGEFFASRGLKSAPSRAISVGTRDVLLNEFDMYDQKWKMAKAELISATTPELLTKWVAWVDAGPARGDLRSR